MAPSSQQSGNGIVELDVIASQKRPTSGVEFERGSSPPRVQRIQHNSYLIGRLFNGDRILSVNGQEIRTAQDFDRIVNVKEPKQQRLHIRIQRDQAYQISVQSVEKNGERTIIELRVRWRRDRKMGVNMLRRDDRTIVEEVVPGSLAQGHVQYGDIITHVDGDPVGGMHEAKKRILSAIDQNQGMVLRIERPTKIEPKDQPMQSKSKPPIPNDVKKILTKLAKQGFWKNQHSDPPAIDKSQERNPTTNTFSSASTQRATTSSAVRTEPAQGTELHVHIQQPGNEDIQRIPTDDKTAPKMTPNRPGSEKRDKDKTN